MKQMKYFSDNEQGMPPSTLTEINVAIWNGKSPLARMAVPI